MTAKTAQLSVALPSDPVACGQTSPGLPTRLWGALTPASAEYISILSPHGPNYSGSIQLVDQAPPPSRSLQSAAPAGPRRPQQHVVEEFDAFARLAKVKKRRPVTPPWERDKRAWEAAKLVAQQQKKVKELEKTQRKRRKGGRFPPPSPGSGAGSSLGALLKRNVQKQIKIDNMKGKSIVQRCKSLRLPLRPSSANSGPAGASQPLVGLYCADPLDHRILVRAETVRHDPGFSRLRRSATSQNARGDPKRVQGALEAQQYTSQDDLGLSFNHPMLVPAKERRAASRSRSALGSVAGRVADSPNDSRLSLSRGITFAAQDGAYLVLYTFDVQVQSFGTFPVIFTVFGLSCVLLLPQCANCARQDGRQPGGTRDGLTHLGRVHPRVIGV